MDKTIQQEMVYLMERVTEPLYYGPRGNHNMYFDVPLDGLTIKERTASSKIRQEMGAGGTFNVALPKDMPDLKTIAMNCPKEALFSYFLPNHREAAAQLASVLKAQPNTQEFVSACAVTRDSSMINTQLWVHATIKASLERSDMRGVRFPALWEIMPDLFISPAVRMAAQKQAAMPMTERSVVSVNDASQITGARTGTPQVVVDSGFSGRSENPENKLAYFREDLGIASHHWHWHIIYAGGNRKDLRNRRGELFYYMHHGMLARYDAERLCNGLPRTRTLDVSSGGSIEEGYFPKLTAENSGRIWGGRQANTLLSNIDRYDDGSAFKIDIDDMRKWKDRILDAIDTGIVMTRDPVTKKLDRVPLTPETGTNILGDMIENGGMSAPNPAFYGNLHNMGHVVIGFSHDPEKHHNENIGAMGSEATAMKDPSFYRWHKFIDQIFEKFKNTLDPYTEEELVFRGVRVKSIQAQTKAPGTPPNVLRTHWMESDIDLSRGLDIGRRSSMGKGPIWARFTHLNHHPFEYTIIVDSVRANVDATVRIFLAPHKNEHGEVFRFSQQRLLFFEMDKYTVTLSKGENILKRRSDESTVTIPWEQSFRDLEALMDSSDTLMAQNAICGCGWPQHLLVPKGTEGPGFEFDLVVMLTDSAEDLKNLKPRRHEATCKESIGFCGILNEDYPDAKPMGFPWDRTPRRTGNDPMMGMEAPFLQDFIPINSNMMSQRVRVSFDGTSAPILRPGSATMNMDVLPPPSQAKQNPNRNRNGGGGGRGGGAVQFSSNSRRSRQDGQGEGPGSEWGYADGGRWRNHNDRDSSPDHY